jgi:hypothetical protein
MASVIVLGIGPAPLKQEPEATVYNQPHACSWLNAHRSRLRRDDGSDPQKFDPCEECTKIQRLTIGSRGRRRPNAELIRIGNISPQQAG